MIHGNESYLDRVKRDRGSFNALENDFAEKGSGLTVGNFEAQFGLNVKAFRYCTNDGPANQNVEECTPPVFIFGQSDKAGNYANAVNQSTLPQNMIFKGAGIFPAFEKTGVAGADNAFAAASIAKVGDLVLSFYRVTENIGVTVTENIYIIVSCSQVAMGTLLDATSSDTFVISKIRYALPSSTDLSQYFNEIQLLNLTLFGRKVSDSFNPNDFKLPNQQQDNIIDMLVSLGIDKQKCLQTYVNIPSVVVPSATGFIAEVFNFFQWTVFVQSSKRILA